ncbi:hypothetical protein Q3G72_034392 [Acer saccharum]|nr:hypothetical protein Q3G72_034392 [Acer saccharum]
MLDLDDIALELGYKLPVGFWIQLPGVLDLFLEPIEALQTVRGDEVIQYQHPEAHNDWAEADMVVNGHDVIVNGPDVGGTGSDVVGLNEESVDELNGEAAEKDKLQRKEKGKQVAEEVESDGAEETESDGGD